MQNFMDNLKPSSGDGQDDVPWWMKYAGKGMGVVAGLVAIFSGLFACITLSPTCIVSGIWQILAGVLVISVEAPFLCMFLDFVQQFSSMVDGRPIWQKGLVYLILAIPAPLLCIQISTIIGSGLIFATAVLYGMQVLGKKAPREEMAAAASNSSNAPSNTTPAPTENMRSGLVENIQGQDVEAAKGKK